MLNVRAGTLDDTTWLRPSLQAWTSSKQPWLVLDERIPAFEGQPEKR
jgi:hypothetical protein